MALQKTIKTSLSAIGLSLLAGFSHAATITINGVLETGVGAIATLAPIGTPFAGSIEWSGQLDAGNIKVSGFCFTTEATGLPPVSPGCSNTYSPMPILPTGDTAYSATTNPPGTTFEQGGTTFDGNSGLLKITSYSPTLGLPLFIDLTFNGDETGDFNLYTSSLGDATGSFTYSAVPIPAAGWLFGSSLLGLAATARRRRAT